MKNFLKSFIHQPKKVILVSLIVAVVIGFFGYSEINKIQTGQFLKNNNVSLKNLMLNFSASGEV
jgi:hypothetical protein